MYIQGIENVYDLDWDGANLKVVRTTVIFLNVPKLNFLDGIMKRLKPRCFGHLVDAEAECGRLLARYTIGIARL